MIGSGFGAREANPLTSQTMGFYLTQTGGGADTPIPRSSRFKVFWKGAALSYWENRAIGKSWAIKRESAEIQRSLTVGAKMLFKDLRSFGDESRLMDSLSR